MGEVALTDRSVDTDQEPTTQPEVRCAICERFFDGKTSKESSCSDCRSALRSPMDEYRIRQLQKYWAVYEGSTLICITVYRKGAVGLIGKLRELGGATD